MACVATVHPHAKVRVCDARRERERGLNAYTVWRDVDSRNVGACECTMSRARSALEKKLGG